MVSTIGNNGKNTLTQYNPITAGVNNYFRYLNKSRTELPKQNWAV